MLDMGNILAIETVASELSVKEAQITSQEATLAARCKAAALSPDRVKRGALLRALIVEASFLTESRSALDAEWLEYQEVVKTLLPDADDTGEIELISPIIEQPKKKKEKKEKAQPVTVAETPAPEPIVVPEPAKAKARKLSAAPLL